MPTLTAEHRARWRQLRNTIAGFKNPDRFDMSSWLTRVIVRTDSGTYTCGTAGCLAGHAAILSVGGEENLPRDPDDDEAYDGLTPTLDQIAREWLGIDQSQSNYVFLGDWTNTRIPDITRDEALAYLDAVIETGNPMASLCKPDENELTDLASATYYLVETFKNLSPETKAVIEAVWDAAPADISFDDAVDYLANWRDHVTAVAAPQTPHTTAGTCVTPRDDQPATITHADLEAAAADHEAEKRYWANRELEDA